MVVLGHAIQYTIGHGFEANPVVRFIHAFDMPLFMFISGFVSAESHDRSTRKLFLKFRSLVIPFLAWFVLYFACASLAAYRAGTHSMSFGTALGMLLRSPDAGLWFLWILFLNHLVLFIARWIDPRREELYMLLMLVLINICWRYFKMDYLGIGLLRWHLAFYLIGYAANKHSPAIGGFLTKAGIVSGFVFPFLLVFFMSNGVPTFYNTLHVDPRLRDIICLLYNYTVAITAILAMHTYFRWLIQTFPIIEKPLLYFGRHTIEIYCCHALFFSLIADAYISFWALVLVKSCVALLLSLAVQYLIKRSQALSMVLYGRR